MMSDYCNNCGRRSHCGTSLSEVLEPGRESDGTPLIKICDNCRCDDCVAENENRYSDCLLCTSPSPRDTG